MSERYQRQISIIGDEGQRRLNDSTVFIAGAGGLGSPAAFYLAAAGVGKIRVADSDLVEVTNLNRQILHTSERIGMPKVLSAKKTLETLNPEIHVEAFHEVIDEKSVQRLIGDSDIIVDAMDNFSARYVLNKAAFDLHIPLMHGAVSGFSGQATLIIPNKTPCLSCIFPKAETSVTQPILGTTAGVIGSIQAEEVIKYLTDTGETLAGKLLLWDGKVNQMDLFTVKKSTQCCVCGYNQKL